MKFLPGTTTLAVWVTATREAGPIRVIEASGRNFLTKATRGKNRDPAS